MNDNNGNNNNSNNNLFMLLADSVLQKGCCILIPSFSLYIFYAILHRALSYYIILLSYRVYIIY